MSPRQLSARLLGALACAVPLVAAACSSSTGAPDNADPVRSVPTSASVQVPPGAPPITAVGTVLDIGASAVLPANAFDADGPTAMYTVTGITPAADVPKSIAQGGTPYFLYVTLTSLADNPAPAPSTVGISASADGRTAALTRPPSETLDKCANPQPPKTMKRGDSYATCLVAVADKGQKLHQVIYWADTGAEGTDYKKSPVVWRDPAEAASSAGPGAPAAPPAQAPG